MALEFVVQVKFLPIGDGQPDNYAWLRISKVSEMNFKNIRDEGELRQSNLYRASLAPIIVFVYNRPDKLRRCLVSLKNNHLASQSDLFIISDGPRIGDQQAVQEVRRIATAQEGFRSITLIARPQNLGATKSIISAEMALAKIYGRIISLEDDNLVSKNFLDFMNSALEFYENNPQVFSITGYKHPFDLPKGYAYSAWLNYWHTPWTYATWLDRLEIFNIDDNNYASIFNSRPARSKLRSRGLFMYDSAWLDWQGFARANDARVCMHMFRRDLVSVAPTESLVFNDGQDGSGLHAKKTSRFDVQISRGNERAFNFPSQNSFDTEIARRYVRFMDKGNVGRIARRLGLLRLRYVLRSVISKIRI